MTVTLCLSCSLVLLNRRPRAHCWMLAFFIASYQHLLWTPNSIGVSEGPLSRVWLSLPHLVSSCLEPSWQLPLPTALARRTQLNYIIVRRPLDLWNRITLNGIFGWVKRSKHNYHPLIIFQNSICGIFFTFVSITLTHILLNNLQGQ